MEAHVKLKCWACLAKVGKIQVSRQFSQQSVKQVTNPNADRKRDDIQTQCPERHLILAQENPHHRAIQTCPLTTAPQLTAAHFLFFSLAYVQGTGKPNSCSLLWSPSVHSQPRVCCSILPRIIPLGSSGGCQTIRTDVSLTSGNTSLTGGPGAAREHRDHGSKDCTAEGSQVFCSPCTELQPKTYLYNNGWQHLCVCIIHIHSEESAHG